MEKLLHRYSRRRRASVQLLWFFSPTHLFLHSYSSPLPSTSGSFNTFLLPNCTQTKPVPFSSRLSKQVLPIWFLFWITRCGWRWSEMGWGEKPLLESDLRLGYLQQAELPHCQSRPFFWHIPCFTIVLQNKRKPLSFFRHLLRYLQKAILGYLYLGVFQAPEMGVDKRRENTTLPHVYYGCYH